MTRKQLSALKALKKSDLRPEKLSSEEYDIFCFLSDEGYASYLTGRENNFEFNYFHISEKGKAFLSDTRKLNISFVLALATFIVALATLVVGFLK